MKTKRLKQSPYGILCCPSSVDKQGVTNAVLRYKYAFRNRATLSLSLSLSDVVFDQWICQRV